MGGIRQVVLGQVQIVVSLERSLEWCGVGVILDGPQKLLVLNHVYSFLFEVVVVGW